MSNSRRHCTCTLAAVLTIVALHAPDVFATSFGDTAVGSTQFLTPCGQTTVTSLSVTVDVSSRIYVNGTAPFYGNSNSVYNNGNY
jgi:hypothetical protein